MLAATILALALSGCAQRGSITVDPTAAEVGSVQPLLVASSRAPDPNAEDYTAATGPNLSFSSVNVSVPPDRAIGTVRFSGAEGPDPQRDFLTVSRQRIADEDGFIRAVNQAVARTPPNQREAFVFVHGFNTNFAEGLYRQAQMRHDFGAPGISIHYAWPSAARTHAYAADREAVLQTRDDLEHLIDLLSRTNVTRIVVAGHSMGGFLVMEAMRQRAIRNQPGAFTKVQAVILMAPDIDVSVFRRQARALAERNVSIYVFTSTRDRALRFSAALRGTGPRLGAVSDSGGFADLPVTIINLTEVDGNNDALNHFKVATSPVMISLISGLSKHGSQTLRDAIRRPGVIDGGLTVMQDVTTIVVAPIAQR